MVKAGKKVTINPESYEIRKGKLYLFYNAYFTNTLKKMDRKTYSEVCLVVEA